ncbi:class III cytochrome C family protein [mine drainage metagenome]|uniref:Class III cytochrome C family protein n=1 Tax=mine drainage metagenome TaxID=410659 RepID=A0A1J5TAA9_9ZZZZ
MIHCLLIKITTNSRNLPVRSYHTLTAEELTFGRAAECSVHLPDPRIAMHHAVIKRMNDEQLHIVSINGELEVDGAIQQTIILTQGQQIMIGPYQLTMEPAPPDVDIAASLTLMHRLPDDFQDLKSRTHDPLPNASSFKRKLSAWMAGLITLIFLALPLAQNLIPQLRTAMTDLPFGFDRVWSPGHFSNAHLRFISQCSNCHQTLSRRVTDQACLKCHTDTAPHIADKNLELRAFKTARLSTGGMRCAQCHREHKAPFSLAQQDNANCIKCHGNIKTVNPNTTLKNIHDFDVDHPGFKLTFKNNTKDANIERIPQSDKARLIEKSGIKFPHSQHVGLVQGPGGMWDVHELPCSACHHQDGKEMRFKPVSFKRDCLSCHSQQLVVGPPKARLKIPHSEENNVFNQLKVYAPKQQLQYSENLKSDGCGYCHDIVDSKKGDALPWHIAPVSINQDWFSKAHFNHASHRTHKCQSCHDVDHSESSADVAMPDRKSCLRCHSGNSQKYKRIPSTCMSCHDFHNSHTMSENEVENKSGNTKSIATKVKPN